MNRLPNNKRLSNYEILAIYKTALEKEDNTLPINFWEQKTGMQNAKLCLNYIFKHTLNYSDSEIMKNINEKTLRKYKLDTLFEIYLNKDKKAIYYLLGITNGTYTPVQYLENTINNTVFVFPKDYWKQVGAKQNFKKCFRHLFINILHYTSEDFVTKYSKAVLAKYKLKTAVDELFNGDIQAALKFSYPELFKLQKLI